MFSYEPMYALVLPVFSSLASTLALGSTWPGRTSTPPWRNSGQDPSPKAAGSSSTRRTRFSSGDLLHIFLYMEGRYCRPDTSMRQQRRLPLLLLTIALVPLKCWGGRNLQFPHWLLFTTKKMSWFPCPFKSEAYRLGTGISIKGTDTLVILVKELRWISQRVKTSLIWSQDELRVLT